MHQLFPILVLALCLSTVACKSTKSVGDQAQATEQVDVSNPELLALQQNPADYPSNLALRLQRTSCFGNCPVYTTVVFADGTGIHFAKHHKTPEGTFSFKLSEKDLKLLLDKAASIGYFALNDAYKKPVSDFPTTYTYVNNGKQRKQIENYRGAPEKLKEFEKLVDEVTVRAPMNAVK